MGKYIKISSQPAIYGGTIDKYLSESGVGYYEQYNPGHGVNEQPIVGYHLDDSIIRNTIESRRTSRYCDDYMKYCGNINVDFETYTMLNGCDEFKISKLIFNEPATIIFWKDGTKTVVTCGPEDEFDPYKGIALCFMKKLFRNKGSYNNVFRKYDDEITEAVIESELKKKQKKKR